MRITAKGRYAMAATLYMAENYREGEYITLISISEKLGISKIYLEQVFSLLKLSGIVTSIKGAQGGYQLARPARQITAFDILSSVETALFESAEETLPEKAPHIEKAMVDKVFTPLDIAIRENLQAITLSDLSDYATLQKGTDNFMYFI